MPWLLIPADDRAAARKVAQRIDQILGFPRALAPSEYRHVGRGRHAVQPYTESQLLIMVHDNTGATILHGAIAISLDAVIDALRDRLIDPGDGLKQRLQDIIANRGWETRANLPGQLDAWTQIAPRDGAEGSPDGTPIPEGQE